MTNSLYAKGEVLTDHRGRKIQILENDKEKYLIKYHNEEKPDEWIDTHVIDTFFCLSLDIEEHFKYANLIGDARNSVNITPN